MAMLNRRNLESLDRKRGNLKFDSVRGINPTEPIATSTAEVASASISHKGTQPVAPPALAGDRSSRQMDEIHDRLLASDEIESRLVSGWAALEHHDIEEARAVLHDVYEVCPEHPGLPLLAAGIRRARPKPIPWRAAVLAVAAIVAAAVGYASLNRPPRPLPAQPIVSVATVPDVSPRATATSGQLDVPATPEPRRGSKDTAGTEPQAVAPLDDEAQIREAIGRFVTAYRTRWMPLAFEGCDLTPQPTTALATCRTRPAGEVSNVGAADVWTFRLQKSASTWKILSVQPSSAPDRP